MTRERALAPDWFDGMQLDWSCKTDEGAIARVRDYWQSMRQGRPMPSRRDVNPGELRDVLPILQLYELIDGGKALRVRLLGTKIAQALGEDPTGHTITWATSDRLTRRVFAIADRVTKHRRPLIARAERTAIEKASFLQVESIYLPLAEDGHTPDTLLAATVFSDADDVWRVE
jgi:hypothetical protein